MALATLLAFFARGMGAASSGLRHEALLRSRRSTLISWPAWCCWPASVLLPQDFGWNIGRFVFSLACLPPFFYCLIRLQRADAPVKRTRRPVGELVPLTSQTLIGAPDLVDDIAAA